MTAEIARTFIREAQTRLMEQIYTEIREACLAFKTTISLSIIAGADKEKIVSTLRTNGFTVVEKDSTDSTKVIKISW